MWVFVGHDLCVCGDGWKSNGISIYDEKNREREWKSGEEKKGSIVEARWRKYEAFRLGRQDPSLPQLNFIREKRAFECTHPIMIHHVYKYYTNKIISPHALTVPFHPNIIKHQ